MAIVTQDLGDDDCGAVLLSPQVNNFIILLLNPITKYVKNQSFLHISET